MGFNSPALRSLRPRDYSSSTLYNTIPNLQRKSTKINRYFAVYFAVLTGLKESAHTPSRSCYPMCRRSPSYFGLLSSQQDSMATIRLEALSRFKLAFSAGHIP